MVSIGRRYDGMPRPELTRHCWVKRCTRARLEVLCRVVTMRWHSITKTNRVHFTYWKLIGKYFFSKPRKLTNGGVAKAMVM
jgi:hypothetical protein